MTRALTRQRLSPSVGGTAMLALRPRQKLSITLLVALVLGGKLALYRLALLLWRWWCGGDKVTCIK